ncbi:MAG: ATP-binding protein, partial [Bacteroidota bacterium]
EQGKIEFKPKLIDLRALISTSIESSEGQFKPGQEVILSLADEPQRIVADAKLLRHVLVNLLSNAAKYSGEGNPVTVATGLKDGRCFISIIDRGIGIPEEDQKHLFDRFFRATNVENVKGTGLGLNIVKHYVELMEAELTFKSQLGEGSTFTVWLDGIEKEDK